jgi:hypothetical protein
MRTMVPFPPIFLFLLPAVLASRSQKHVVENFPCDRKWPSLDIFMPVNLKTRTGAYEFESYFLRSFLLFWPLKLSNVSLNIAIDAESNSTIPASELYETLGWVKDFVPGGTKITLLPQSNFYRRGYDRQQLVMFWADNFTDSEYVGFVDSDTAFLTYIDREDLFEGGKPVVNGKSGHIGTDNIAYEWTRGSERVLGILEPFRCMSYFPVIIKVDHLKGMRDYIADRYNSTFDNAFYHNISGLNGGSSYSQFAIMCTYLWAFKRDEYQWYVHSETPSWDGRNPPPGPGQDGNLTQFTTEMNTPKPRIAAHARYRPKKLVRTKLIFFICVCSSFCPNP